MATIQLRRDTTLNWETKEPTLKLGEPGLELDNGLMKMGDGINIWSNLPYMPGGDITESQIIDLGTEIATKTELADSIGDITMNAGYF